MNDNHTKRCLISLAVREMQIITRRHQYTRTMAAKIKKKKAVIRPNAGNSAKKLGLPTLLVGMDSGAVTLEHRWAAAS